MRDDLSGSVTTTAYYVTAEAIANALKHSTASRLELSVDESGGRLRVRVSDDGQGGATIGQHGGLGSLRDRVAATGGVLRVTSRPGLGTTVEAELPVEETSCAS